MPRGAGRARRGNSSTAVLDTPEETQETTPMTTSVDSPDVDDTDDSVQFDLSVEAAPADYTPERKVPGRQRRTSFFDDVLRADGVYEGGWQRVPVTSEEHKAYVQRELNRAKLYLNGTGKQDGEDEIGLDIDDKQDDALYFKSRKAQKRERKANGGSEALNENAAEEGTVDPDGDNDE